MRGRIITLLQGIAIAGIAATGALPSEATAGAESAMPFLPHQALYDLSLVKSRRSPSVDAVQGRIAYTFAGSACEGYTTEFRQVSRIEAGEGEPKLSDLRSISWEDGAGKSFRFHIETRMDNAAARVVDGQAEQGAKGVVVHLKQPQKKTITLEAGVVFPTEQIRRILAAARAGKSLLELVVYDGSDNGEKLYNTLAVIGSAVSGDRATGKPDIAGADATLHKMTRWPVTVSYYDRSEESAKGEQTPVYTMSFELYENGVSRALSFDYNDFVVGGVMTKYDPQAAKPCK